MPKIVNTFDALSFRYLLLDCYKELKINENELCVLLMCDHLLEQGNKFITADLLRLKMSLHTSELDKILVSLLNKKLIEYVSSKDGMVTSLEPIRVKLRTLFESELLHDKSSIFSAERKSIHSSLVKQFETKLERKLSPIEEDMISSWLDDDFSSSQIIDALLLSLKDGKKTFRAFDHALKDIRIKDDVNKEGYSAVNQDSWSKDIEKTIQIAKVKWLDEDK